MFVSLSRRQPRTKNPNLALLWLRGAIARAYGSPSLIHIPSSNLFSSTRLAYKGNPPGPVEVADRPESSDKVTAESPKKKKNGAGSDRPLRKAEENEDQKARPTKPRGLRITRLAPSRTNKIKKAMDASTSAERVAELRTATTKAIKDTTAHNPDLEGGKSRPGSTKVEVEDDVPKGPKKRPTKKRRQDVAETEGNAEAHGATPSKPLTTAAKKKGKPKSESRRKPPRPELKADIQAKADKEAEQLAGQLRNLQNVQNLVQLVEGGKLSGNAKSAVLKALRGALASGSPIFQTAKPPSLPAPKKPLVRLTGGVRFRKTYSDDPYKEQETKSPVSRTKGVAPKSTSPKEDLETEATSTTEDQPDIPEKLRNYDVKTLNAQDLKLTPIDKGELDVPALSYGLERVLFNPGVYQLQDPRSHVFNFDPYLETIMPVSEFDFSALKEYVTSSRDHELLSTAKIENKKYTGSTSSMSSALAHFHFLISQWRPINTGGLTKTFPVEFETFTALQRAPVAIFVRHRDGVYAIDADKQYDDANILMSLGKSMEKLLTTTTKDFERYRNGNSHQVTEEERTAPEAFHYSTLGDFLLRSQLDAHDPRLPGTGMFDLKTRAVVSVRMNISQYEESRGYEIKDRHGEWGSYEREYYDMIRAAFLKYSMQVRMGRMDGIFVAFHNTERIFGFQYISLEEMDYCIHGSSDLATGDGEFKLSLNLLNQVLDKATAKFPGKTIRMHFETRPAVTPFMYIFAEPFEEADVEAIQKTNQAKIEKFEREVLGLGPDEDEWAKLEENVEDTMAIDEIDPEGASQEPEGGSPSTAIQEEDTEGAEEDESSAAVAGEDGEDNAQEDAEEDDEEGDDEAEEDDDEEVEEHDAEQDEEDGNEETVELEAGEPKEGEELTNVSEGSEAEQTFMADDGTVEDAEIPDDVEEAEDSLDSESSSEPESTSEATSDTGATETDSTEESTSESPINEAVVASAPLPMKNGKKEILAMTLTVRNKVNGIYAVRPADLKKTDDWELEYALREIEDPEQAWALYDAVKMRRKKMMTSDIDVNKRNARNDNFLSKLQAQIRAGRAYRAQMNKAQKGKPQKVLDVAHPATWPVSEQETKPEEPPMNGEEGENR